MISVKHIGTGGEEMIHLAHEVRFNPSPANAQCFTRSPWEAAHDDGDITIIQENRLPLGLVGGIVFVMNDQGKTIARYDLTSKRPTGGTGQTMPRSA